MENLNANIGELTVERKVREEFWFRKCQQLAEKCQKKISELKKSNAEECMLQCSEIGLSINPLIIFIVF